uniref:Uncharacterized protein n=1 Tax=Anguilla anguilla TaxID=7936 RepID=A0A0E9WMP3_ANGAN
MVTVCRAVKAGFCFCRLRHQSRPCLLGCHSHPPQSSRCNHCHLNLVQTRRIHRSAGVGSFWVLAPGGGSCMASVDDLTGAVC